jgi:hypothetical protein
VFENLGLNLGLGAIPLLTDGETRSICAENPDGSRGAAARAVPDSGSAGSDLGQGWKIRPCITIDAGSTTTLADIKGPGVIQHIWITVGTQALRDCVLRFYWDEEKTPSIETPLGDFFALGHGLRYNVVSIPVAVNPSGGMNSYWPMPFRKHCKITVENQRWEAIGGFFYQITYGLNPVPDNAAYLHAQWRRSVTPRSAPQHVILDGVKGAGHYVGTFLAWTQLANGWWGEGEVKFFMDGDGQFATICGTGTEDYFGGAWGFGDTFTGPFLGYPLWQRNPEEVPKHGLYRWHIMDPIRFRKDLKVTIQALGWWPNGKYQPLEDDIASVGYWYQAEPHAAFPELPGIRERWPR